MKDRKVYDSCFGRCYDANIRECKECEVGKECKVRRLEYGKYRVNHLNDKNLTNPYRVGTVRYVCYEELKHGGTFKEIELLVMGELKKRKIGSVNVCRTLREVLLECRKGGLHSGGKYIHNAGEKTYRVVDKNE